MPNLGPPVTTHHEISGGYRTFFEIYTVENICATFGTCITKCSIIPAICSTIRMSSIQIANVQGYN